MSFDDSKSFFERKDDFFSKQAAVELVSFVAEPVATAAAELVSSARAAVAIAIVSLATVAGDLRLDDLYAASSADSVVLMPTAAGRVETQSGSPFEQAKMEAHWVSALAYLKSQGEDPDELLRRAGDLFGQQVADTQDDA